MMNDKRDSNSQSGTATASPTMNDSDFFDHIKRIEKKLDKTRALVKRHIAESPLSKDLIIPSHMVWRCEDYFVQAQSRVSVPGIPGMRCFFLQSCLRSLINVPGAVAECGVREGKSSLYLLYATNTERQFFLFDSFEGLSDPHPQNDTLPSAVDPQTGERIFAGNSEQVIQRFEPFTNVTVLPGWIPERFHVVSEEHFAFVHIDVDLYEPTRDSLEFFYPRLSKSGMIICDDYGSGAYPGARRAMDEFFADKAEMPIELPQGQAFIVKR